MKISARWLKEYIKTDRSVDDIADYLTDLGLEVEGIHHFELVKGGLNGIVVGEVIECKKHPNADKLKLTKVKVNKKKTLQIICGAPNVAIGQKVPVALVGSVLYPKNDKEVLIRSSKIRGEESNGMICAEDELGIGNSHDGIMVLNNNLEIGKPLKDALGIEDDYIYEIGLTPNRADAMSHMGIARDLKAYFIQNKIDYIWNSPKIENLPSPSKTKKINIQVDEPELAPYYFGITLTNINVLPSPDWIQNYLRSIGITPKNNVVDITNFVLHDIGQPLHSFDADKIEGDIIVKKSKKGTKFLTLDHNEVELSDEDLMICDQNKPLCLAGIYGGKDSGVSKSTKSIFLESAYFNAQTIRKSAKRHGFNTDASYRFERGIDPEICLIALKRAVFLMTKYANAVISSEIVEFQTPNEVPAKIFISYEQINNTIGQDIPKEDLTNILNALEIKIDNVTNEGIAITIPLYRVDVKRPSDVIEEILRIYGYNSINSSSSLKINLPQFKVKNKFKFQEYLSEKLVGYGFSEIINNSIVNPSYNLLAKDTLSNESISILNPLGKNLSELRKTLIYSTLEVISFNNNRKKKNLKLFETGNVYSKKNNNYEENKFLLISLSRSKEAQNWISKEPISPFFEIKTHVINLFKSINMSKISFDTTESDFFSEGLTIKYDGSLIGKLGIVKTSITSNFNIENQVCICEIKLDDIYDKAFDLNFKIKDIPKFPSIQRDFSLLINQDISFSSIKEIALNTEKKFLESVDLFDVYEGEKISNSKKSYGIRFTFTDMKKTLTDKHIDKVMNKLLKEFQIHLNAELR